jgi:integrase
MTAAVATAAFTRSPSMSQLRPSGYDRRELTAAELSALRTLGPVGLRRSRARGATQRAALWAQLTRLVGPIDEVRSLLHHPDDVRYRRASAHAAGLVLQHCADTGHVYWSWTHDEWAELCASSAEAFVAARVTPTETTVRPFLVAHGYLLGGFDEFHRLGTFNRLHLAQLVFGAAAIEDSLSRAGQTLNSWGYRGVLSGKHRLRGGLSQALLINGSARLEDLTTEAFRRLRAHPATNDHHGELLFALQRAAAELGYCEAPVRTGRSHMPIIEGADPVWAGWVERWHATSTLTTKVRAIVRTIMAKAGRWLASEHPQITEPEQWTRQTCAAWVAAIDRMRVGDYVQRTDSLAGRAGVPISPRTKAHLLMASRTFFRDCQEWEWIPRRFDPARAMAVPRSIAALISTNPRVIADEIWAKLLWAGLNLAPADLPGNSADSYYPMPLIRAVTLTWLFSGLRSDELSRLRVGCVRWQHDGSPIAADTRDVLANDAVCLLDVPVHKTGTAFTKPVDPLLGQAIEAWQYVRPPQPSTIDRKTVNASTCSSPSARNRSPAPTSTRRSSRPSARRPAFLQPTSAGRSPATEHGRPSQASSTTPRNR